MLEQTLFILLASLAGVAFLVVLGLLLCKFQVKWKTSKTSEWSSSMSQKSSKLQRSPKIITLENFQMNYRIITITVIDESSQSSAGGTWRTWRCCDCNFWHLPSICKVIFHRVTTIMLVFGTMLKASYYPHSFIFVCPHYTRLVEFMIFASIVMVLTRPPSSNWPYISQ